MNVEATRRHLFELQDLPPEAGASIGLEECQRSQAHAQEAIARAQRMLDSLRYVATPSREPKTYVDPKVLIDNVLRTLKNRTPSHIRIHREETATRPILARPGNVSRVLVDLLANALDAAAAPEAGEITIRTHQIANSLILAITDNGAGISTEHHKRVFTPFYTTKPHGSGLSLYAARRIVADHGGSLTFASIPNEATTFSLDLPYHSVSHTLDRPAQK